MLPYTVNPATPYLKSGMSLLAVTTTEQDRFERLVLKETYVDDTGATRRYDAVYSVSADLVMQRVTLEEQGDVEFIKREDVLVPAPPKAQDKTPGKVHSYPSAFQYQAMRAEQGERNILLVYDFSHFTSNRNPQPAMFRSLMNRQAVVQQNGCHVILVAASWLTMLPEYRAEVKVLRLPLPTMQQLNIALDLALTGTMPPVVITPEMRERVLRAAIGLTEKQATDAFALAMTYEDFDAEVVMDMKMDIMRAAGVKLAKPWDPKLIGGFSELKESIVNEVVPTYGGKRGMRRVLLFGIYGSGKSISAKAYGAYLQLPVALIEFSKLKGKFVGESEENLARVLEAASACQNIVIWIDELEDAMGDADSSNKTGSTTGSMVGVISTWMEEEQPRGVFMVCTANSLNFPNKILRRFDETWFIDLPRTSERREIAMAQFNMAECEFADDTQRGEMADHLTKLSDGWTGDEIRKCVESAARRTDGKLTLETLTAAAGRIMPISKLKADEIQAMRDYGLTYARVANSPEDAVELKATTARKISKLKLKEEGPQQLDNEFN